MRVFRFGVIVWLCLVGLHIIGVHFFHMTFNGSIRILKYNRIILQKDSAPACYSRYVNNYNNKRFMENLLGTNEQIR